MMSPVLRIAEDMVPYGSAVVLIVAAASLAVIVRDLATTAAAAPIGSIGKKNKKPAERRRMDGCDLALLPDGSKDKANRYWRRELSPERYASLREAVTDPANLPVEEGGMDDNFHEDGVFVCAGCGAELYNNEARFEAGCGWVSTQPLEPRHLHIAVDLLNSLRAAPRSRASSHVYQQLCESGQIPMVSAWNSSAMRAMVTWAIASVMRAGSCRLLLSAIA